MNDAIGGYFGLEINAGKHYHQGALQLNTARNCLEYILLSRQYKKVYIPFFTCEVTLQPLKKLSIEYQFYRLDNNFEPKEIVALQPSEAFLYTNYFGLKQNCVERLATIYGNQLIVDDAQAFFAPRIAGVDTFYSARKFFGVSDGAYLYIDKELDVKFSRDYSYGRMMHLLKRLDLSAESGYDDFKSSEESLNNQDIKLMSDLTSKVLASIEYERVRRRRRDNFNLYSQAFYFCNTFDFDLSGNDVPMAYPFFTEDLQLRGRLINNRIFVATYWNNIFDWCEPYEAEYIFAKNIIPLPVDQRLNREDIERIITTIEDGKI